LNYLARSVKFGLDYMRLHPTGDYDYFANGFNLTICLVPLILSAELSGEAAAEDEAETSSSGDSCGDVGTTWKHDADVCAIGSLQIKQGLQIKQVLLDLHLLSFAEVEAHVYT
jgi:hypothetical protein